MKKIFIAVSVSLMALWSVGAMANIGVVDMQKIFQSSPKAKKINAALEQQFASRREGIVKLGQKLQEEVKDYQKNQSVLGKDKLQALQGAISEHSTSLRQAQTKFQSDLLAAQNEKMASFLKDLKASVQKVAEKKGLDLVLPGNAVLYSKTAMDITSDVLSSMS